QEMQSALASLGKPVTLVKLPGEDWLSTVATRLEVLEDMDRFLRQYLQKSIARGTTEITRMDGNPFEETATLRSDVGALIGEMPLFSGLDPGLLREIAAVVEWLSL